MPKYKDITGQRFGRLTVLRYSHSSKRGTAYWVCRCDCGTEATRRADSLNGKNKTPNCGCLVLLHGHARWKNKHSATYRTWTGMKNRCLNPKQDNYPRYGGAGVTICERWMTFANFLADMGEKPPGATLDRIKNELGYFKENCRWESPLTQGRHRKNVREVLFQGRPMTLTEAAEISGIDYFVLYQRLKRLGWPKEIDPHTYTG
jgi:hypothetical protein